MSSLVLPEQWDQICSAIATGHSTLVLGEVGLLGDLPQQLHRHFQSQVQGGLRAAIAIYKGSGKRFFVDLADQLGCCKRSCHKVP